MLFNRLKLFWERNWFFLAIGALILVTTVLPFWVLFSYFKPEVREYVLAINLASIPFGVVQTLVFVAFLYHLQYGGGFARFKKTNIKADEVKVKFADVIGLGEAKREAWEVVQLIRDRKKVQKIGGKILKGVLMVGPPGCGKTLLAKAIATEAGIPFLTVAGSEFVEIFVGVGASRVRKLFKQARQYAEAYGSCIIFIDELDVVGRNRVFNSFGGSEESNSTLNQLLVEMDGLHEAEANVVVIGATNAGEGVLDAALVRPGRFDRRIHVGRPNLEERGKIFEYYLSKVRRDPEIDVLRLARKAVYKTPAEIENIIKEAALIATRNKKEAIGYKEMTEAIERIELGIAHRLNLTPREREMTAYHEAGHLIVLYLTHPTSDVFKISIIQRGGTLGVVHSVPREELYSSDRNTIVAHIKVALAGYVAEKLKYGVSSDGVRVDFQNAMHYAHDMVWKYGMGGEGLVGDFASIPKEELSEALKEKLNAETQTILKTLVLEVEVLLKSEWTILERFARELISREELDYDEIVAVFMEYGKPPRLMPTPTVTALPVEPAPMAPKQPPVA